MNNFIEPLSIPAYITVHLDSPERESENVTVSFPDYIKGVASATEIENLPNEALKAVLYSQITLALNRINDRVYRKKRYPFDITSDEEFDQPYAYNGETFERVSKIIDEIFTQYIAREYDNYPIDAVVCYGGAIRCRGLSVEQSITLAQNGMDFLEILRYSFGRDIYIEDNTVLTGLQTDGLLTYPLAAFDRGKMVSGLQIALNQIGQNYSSIPHFNDIDGIYGNNTAEAVSEFQRIFYLSQTGNVDQATFHKLSYIYDSVRKPNELVAIGQELEYIPREFRADLEYGSVGESVKLLQYYLLFVSVYENRVPPLDVIGVFGEKTYQSVVSFQKVFGFEPNGIVTKPVWDFLYLVYEALYSVLPPSAFSKTAVEYFGNILLPGSQGIEVRYLQEYLNVASRYFGDLSPVNVTGYFDEMTEKAVIEFQKLFNINPSGVVSSTTWRVLSQIYNVVNGGV